MCTHYKLLRIVADIDDSKVLRGEVDPVPSVVPPAAAVAPVPPVRPVVRPAVPPAVPPAVAAVPVPPVRPAVPPVLRPAAAPAAAPAVPPAAAPPVYSAVPRSVPPTVSPPAHPLSVPQYAPSVPHNDTPWFLNDVDWLRKKVIRLKIELKSQANVFQQRFAELAAEKVQLQSEICALKHEIALLQHLPSAHSSSSSSEANASSHLGYLDACISSTSSSPSSSACSFSIPASFPGEKPSLSSTKSAVHIPDIHTPSTLACETTLKHRTQTLKQVIGHLSSTRESEQTCTSDDAVVTLAHFMKHNKDLTRKACQRANVSTVTRLEPNSSVDLKAALNLPMTKYRALKRFLESRGISVLSSDSAVRKEMKSRSSAVQDLEVGVALVCEKETIHKVPFARVSGIRPLVSSAVSEKCDALLKDSQFNGELWLRLGCDKGGDSTKLVFAVSNLPHCNNTANTHIVAMYEGTDSPQHLWDLFGCFREEFISMDSVSIAGTETKVRKFMFGDYHWLCDSFGHQGASSCFPCLWCLVPLEHLRLKDGTPHCPKVRSSQSGYVDNPQCQYQLRTLEQMDADHTANANDIRNRGNVYRNGKFHHSIVRDSLFPVADSSHIVPLPLHIALGCGLKFYKQLEAMCKQLDASSDLNSPGPLQLKLQSILEKDLHIEKQAYHSQSFVGNHIQKMVQQEKLKGIDNPKVLVSVLEAHRFNRNCYYFHCFPHSLLLIHCYIHVPLRRGNLKLL
jgi:hypothetical protein